MGLFNKRHGRQPVRRKRRRKRRRTNKYHQEISSKGGSKNSYGSYGNYKMPSIRQQLAYLNKMMKVNTQQIFFGYREANELSDGTGKVILKTDLVTGDELPLHIYPLRNIRQAGTSAVGGISLDSDGHDFSTLASIQYLGTKGQAVQDAQAMTVRKLFCNYHDIKIMLWGQATKKNIFKLYLVKFQDEELDPALAPVVTDQDIRDKRVLLFKNHFLRSAITNPVIAGEVLSNNIKREMTVLWTKTYSIRETLSTEDQAQYRLVKIFKKCHNVVDYFESPKTETVSNYLDADEIVAEDILNAPTNIPRTQDNIFLIITGNANAEDQTLTYDINIKSKYTVMGEHTQV